MADKKATASTEAAISKLLFKLQCNSRLRLQFFKRRGVKLMLLYNLFFSLVFYSVFFSIRDLGGKDLYSIIVFGVAVLTFPLIGCLADNFFSRYKLVSISLKLIWMTTMTQGAVSIAFYVKGVCDVDSPAYCIVVDVLFKSLFAFGLGSFLVSILQLSMDQLHDASSNEVVAFIAWYVWTWFLGGTIVLFTQNCYCTTFMLLGKLLFPVSASCVLCLDLLFNHWLVKEPPSKNPFKLILSILRYAIKNKHPRLRSAFTYWDNKEYSRIDLAKSKYGGPFSTEEVEDVKTFLRILLAIVCVSSLVGIWFAIGEYSLNMVNHFNDSLQTSGTEDNCHGGQSDCLMKLLVRDFSYLVVVMFVPIHEFIIYPLFRKFVLHTNSAFKFNIFLCLSILNYIVLFVLEVAGYMKLPEELKANLTCDLKFEASKVPLPLTYKWLYFPRILRGFGQFYLLFGSVEFICAHAPYPLKGLVFGFSYVACLLSVILNGVLILPIRFKVQKWKPVVLGCGAWFYLSAVLLFLSFLVIESIFYKKIYKTRRRDEDIHNRHIFAINYYSRYIQYNQELESGCESER